MALLFGLEWFVILGILLALFMAWGIGANDVANAMGTSVGSGALTFRRAILIAAVFEFAGAVLVGAHVTGTVKEGIIDPDQFVGGQEMKFVYGMLAALLAAALWLLIATYYSLPVSTTHSIVGAVMGFGLVALGTGGVDWSVVQKIVLSWMVSPVLGGIVAILVFWIVKKTVLERPDPVAAARKGAPWFAFATVVVIAFATLYKGLKNLKLDFAFTEALALTVAIGLFVSGVVWLLMARSKDGVSDDVRAMSPLSVRERHLKVESIFGWLQIFTAISVAFAHGANDVANAIGPLAGIVAFAQQGAVVAKAEVPLWILVIGGVGIVIGLATYGYKVIRTIGEKITELTPTRGYSAEIAAAVTILAFSRVGIPISTTHTLVGAVIGVGLARGIPALDLKVVGKIFLSWAATLPIAGATAAIFYLLLVAVAG